MRGRGTRRMLMLLTAVVVLTSSLPVGSSGCIIADGIIASDCISDSTSAGQQLVTAKVPLNLRVQWGHAHGYCGEASVQMIAAHHGVWVGQQLVRDLNGGELLVDTFGSVEKALDTLGFEHTTWSVPARHKQTASGQDFSKHARMLMVWMKQNIAQGRVPIFGAKVAGEYDPDYDHIMPAYAVKFWSNHTSNTAQTTVPDSNSLSSSLPEATGSPNTEVLFDDIDDDSLPRNLSLQVNSMWEAAAGMDDEDDDDKDKDGVLSDTIASTSTAAAEGGVLQSTGNMGTQDILPMPQTSMALFLDWESTPEPPPAENALATARLGVGPQPVPIDNSSPGISSSQANSPPVHTIPPHTTGWLPSPQQHPELAKLPGLYAFNASDILVWTNDYGSELQRSMIAHNFFATRSSCRHSELAGGCFSTDSASYAVAMGGLVQPKAGPGSQQTAQTQHNAMSLAGPDGLFRPMRLKITAWSKPGEDANAEPLTRFKATATGYELDVSLCAPRDQPFTAFRFDSYLAFRSTGKKDGSGRPVLANPTTVQELSQRCATSQACRQATFVQTDNLRLGVQEFGPFSAYGSTYFVCVAGAVPAPPA